jgi:hypothetical protein
MATKKSKEATPQSELIVHVGVPKTGTTAIQAYLYDNRADLRKQGVVYPETHLEEFSQLDRSAHHLLAHKWGGWLDSSRFSIAPDEAWKSLAKTAATEPGRYIISSERFSDLLPTPRGLEVMEFICNVMAPTPVKVIGYIREPIAGAESFLKQAVKVGVFKGKKSSYAANPPAFLDYYKLFGNAAEFVGWKNIIVRGYDRKILVGRDAVTDFLDALSIRLVAQPKDDTVSINSSINTASTAVMLKLSELGLDDSPNVVRSIREYLNTDRFKKFDHYSLFREEEQIHFQKKHQSNNNLLIEKLALPDSIASLLTPSDSRLRPSIEEDAELFSLNDMSDFVKIVRDAIRAGMR